MERIKYLAFLLFTVTAFAQQPILVKALSPEDASVAQSFHQRQIELDIEQKTFEKEIIKKYLTTHDEKMGQYPFDSLWITKATPICIHTTSNGFVEADNCPNETAKEKAQEAERKAKQLWVFSGWANGDFEYSDDYKFIVPKRYVHTPSTNDCAPFTTHPVSSTDR